MNSLLTVTVPINFGQKKSGVSLGAKELYDSYFNNYDNKKFNLVSNDKSENLFALQRFIKEEIEEKYKMIVYLGGDHSMSMGTISGQFLNYEKEKCVIWLDAHTDCNNILKSETGNIHGMPVAALLGDLEEPYDKFKCLRYDDICYIGTRSIDNYEKEYIKKHQILNLGINVVNDNLDLVIQKMDNFINNRDVHISFDIDIMDPSLISSTGTPEKQGVNMEQIKSIFTFLKGKNVKSMDIVELNPELGDLNETKNNLFEILDSFFR
jgi:arginase